MATGGGIGAFAVHPSHKYFAVGEKGNDPNIYIYTYPALEIVKVLRKGTERGFASLSFSANGDLLASVGSSPDYLLTVWDWEKEAITLHAKAFGQDVFSVLFSVDNPGKLISSGTGHIRFWKMADTFTGLKLQGDIGKFGKIELSDIESFAILPDAKALSSTEVGYLLLWEGNFIKLRFVRKFARPCHVGAIYVVILEREEGRFVTAGQDGWIRWWDLSTVDAAEVDSDKTMDYEMEPVDEVCIGDNVAIRHMSRWHDAQDPTKNKYLLQDLHGVLWSYDITERKAKQLLAVPGGALHGMDVSPVDHFAATTGADGTVRCWDYTARRQLFHMRFGQPATKLRWAPTGADPKGRTVAVGFEDGVVRVLYRLPNAGGWKRLCTTKPHNKPITVLEYSRCGRFLATAAAGGTIFLLNVPKPDEAAAVVEYSPIGFLNVPSDVNSVSWKDDSKAFLFAMADGMVGEADISSPDALARDTSRTYEIVLPLRWYTMKRKVAVLKKKSEKPLQQNKSEAAESQQQSSEGATTESGAQRPEGEEDPAEQAPITKYSALQVHNFLSPCFYGCGDWFKADDTML